MKHTSRGQYGVSSSSTNGAFLASAVRLGGTMQKPSKRAFEETKPAEAQLRKISDAIPTLTKCTAPDESHGRIMRVSRQRSSAAESGERRFISKTNILGCRHNAPGEGNQLGLWPS